MKKRLILLITLLLLLTVATTVIFNNYWVKPGKQIASNTGSVNTPNTAGPLTAALEKVETAPGYKKEVAHAAETEFSKEDGKERAERAGYEEHERRAGQDINRDEFEERDRSEHRAGKRESEEERERRFHRMSEKERREERERSEHSGYVEAEEEGDEEHELYDGPQMIAKMEFERTKDPATGKVPMERYLTALRQTEQSQEEQQAMRINSPGSVTALSWQERGPNSDLPGPSNGNTRANSGIASGRIRAVMVDSLDATHKTVFIGGVDGGLWKTTDITVTPANWVRINDQLSNLAIAAICQDPRPGFQNIMYFCTGESYYNVDAVDGIGVFKSTDAGNTWNYLATTSSYKNCTRILCDFQGNIYLATRTTGLLRSTAASGGAAWTNITPTGLVSDICDLEISSTSAAGRLHVVSGIFSTQAYRYTDIPATVAAGTWTAPAAAFPSFAMRAEIACSGSTLYALPANASYQVPTIYKSTNGGANWAATTTQPGGGTWASGQGWYALAVDIDPSNANNCIIGGLDTYKTTDGGATWAQISTWVSTTPVNQYVHADVHKIVWYDGGNKLLFACDGGLHYSTDKGVTIRDRNVGLRIKQFYSVAIHPSTTNYFLAGAQDNGVHQFNNAGLSNTVEVTGGDGGFVAIDQNEPLFQFGSYVFNQYRRSTNGGTTWSPVNLSGTAGQFINPFDYDNTANIMYCGDVAGAYRRWTNPQTGSTSAVVSITALGTGSVTAVSVSPYTANRVYLGTGAGKVVIVDGANTIASGSAGTSISTGLPTGTVSCINQGTTDNNLIMCESNYAIQNVWISTNGGTAWTAIDGNLPDMPVRWCMFYPGDNTKAYIATETGVWETTLINGASTVWTANATFPTVRTDMIKYRSSDGTIAAATHGRGLWTTIIGCPTITVTNPATTTGTAAVAFSQTFTQTGAVGGATFSLNSGSLPTGLTLSAAGVLSGTPTQTGSFPITVKVTDGNSCTGTGSNYTLVIGCQTITLSNPVTTTGTAAVVFSQTFTQSGSIGSTTFSLNTGTLPTGLTLSAAGVLSGTPTQTGSFPVTVKVTDGNGCTGTGGTYTLVIGCPTITVTNPLTTTGTANAAFSQNFTQTGAVGAATFSLNTGILPTGLTLSTAGVLSGTPTQTGSFPITVKVTDGNGCIGTGATYTLVIGCQTITVTNPVTTTGTAGVAFSQTFLQSAAIGSTTFSLNSGILPTGLTLSSAGVLSGTPTQTGSFPITVKVTDVNGCIGTGATYTLVIGCQTITVTNPVTTTGTAGVAFSQPFTQAGAVGGATFSINTGILPTGLTLSAAGVLSGTPTQTGSFPITVKVTGGNGCIGTGATYTLVINCQTITVTNPATTTGTANAAFSQTFTQSGAAGGATFSINTGTLPTGLTLSAVGVLSGTPTQTGSFPITVKVTGGNGCIGTGATYTLVIGCQTITVTNPVTTTGTAGVAFSQTFTRTGSIGAVVFSLNTGTLPTGLTLSTAGVLSGTPTQTGSFPITVKVTDANGCIGTGTTYTLVISCQTISVTNPATTTGTAGVAFSQTFTQSGAVAGATFTVNTGTLPTGLTLSVAGVLSGTPTQTGSFPITVKVTDANGCIGTGTTYTLVISCQTISVTNPATTTGTAGVAFSQTFTQTGAVAGSTFTINTGTLPTGLTLSAAGVLSGTPTQVGTFPITVKVTGGNGCIGTGATYSLVIGAGGNITLNLKLFLEGFYIGSSTMRATKFDLGLSVDPTAADDVTVNLWSVANLPNPSPNFTTSGLLHTNGTVSVQFPAAASGNSYYIAVKHRNSIETWSKATVPFTAITAYDFSTALIKAYDDGINPPMRNVGGSVFAFYGGDVNQDGTVDISDAISVQNNANIFAFGYDTTDVTGDGATDLSDAIIVQNNGNLFLFYARPF